MRVQRQAREEMRSLPRYTMRELRQYIGRDGGPVLMAVDGLVFDVTDGRSFYGPGGCYHALTGCDATRLLAKGLLAPESVSEASIPLSDEERHQLEEWKQHYDYKYGPPLGELCGEGDPSAVGSDDASGQVAPPKVVERTLEARKWTGPEKGPDVVRSSPNDHMLPMPCSPLISLRSRSVVPFPLVYRSQISFW